MKIELTPPLPWDRWEQAEGERWPGRQTGFKRIIKPGMLVWKDGIDKPVLVGHINVLGGVCDDCVDFDSKTVIVAYEIVWSEED